MKLRSLIVAILAVLMVMIPLIALAGDRVGG